MMHSRSPSEGIWGSLGDLLLLTPTQSYHLPEAMREKGIKQHEQPLQPTQKYNIKERERDHAPGPRPTRRSHTQS
jgi:hypothetical protein